MPLPLRDQRRQQPLPIRGRSVGNQPIDFCLSPGCATALRRSVRQVLVAARRIEIFVDAQVQRDVGERFLQGRAETPVLKPLDRVNSVVIYEQAKQLFMLTFQLAWFLKERFAGNCKKLGQIGRSIIIEQGWLATLGGNA